MRPIVIIESPFGGLEENILYARRCLLDSISLGEAPFASHLLYPQVLNEDYPEDRARGIILGHAFISRANLVAFYIDRGWSPGMKSAKEVALQKGISWTTRRIGDN